MVVMLLALAEFVYSGLYDTIIMGFENKLRVLGSLNSGLIDGDEHAQLNDFAQETSVCYDPGRDHLYLGYATGPKVVRFDYKNRVFDAWETSSLPNSAHLAFDIVENQILSAEYASSNLRVFSIRENSVIQTVSGPGEIQGLACDVSNIYVVVTNTLFVTKRTSINWHRVGSIASGFVWGISVDGQNTLAVLDLHSAELVVVSSTNAKVLEKKPVVDENSQEYQKYLPLRGVAKVPDGYVVGSLIEPLLINTSEKKIQTLASSQDQQREKRNIFKKIAMVLAKVRENAGLTYMPSVIITDDLKSLVYVVDTAADEFHSLDGYVDPTILEEGIIDSWTKNRPYISGVKFWEDYGLMKSSYFPVLDKNHKVRGLLATDINISIIQDKTFSAVQRVAYSGSITLLAGIILAFMIARRIVKPIQIMKNFALRVAAGGYGETIHTQGAHEIQNMMEAYNNVSAVVCQNLISLKESSKSLDISRKTQELKKSLESISGDVIWKSDEYLFERKTSSESCLFQKNEKVVMLDGLESPESGAAMNVFFDCVRDDSAQNILGLVHDMGLKKRWAMVYDIHSRVLYWDCAEKMVLKKISEETMAETPIVMENMSHIQIEKGSFYLIGDEETGEMRVYRERLKNVDSCSVQTWQNNCRTILRGT